MKRKQRWSVQVDEYPAKGEKMYGPRTIVSSWGRGDTDDYATNIGCPNTEVDEIFIDGWFHCELMGGRDYWLNVGGIDINVRVGKDGRAERIIYRVEAEPGVEIVEDA